MPSTFIPTTADLLAKVATGDRDAWGLLAERHIETIRKVAVAICGDSDLAEDAVQDTFLRVRAGAVGFTVRGADPEGDACRWLKRVAANAAIDLLRRQRQQRTHESIERENAGKGLLDSSSTGAPEDPRRVALTRALDRMAAPARAVIELRYREDLDGGALAAALGVGRIAARVRLYRAMATLRRHLADEGMVIAPALLIFLLPPPAAAVETVSEGAFAVPVPLLTTTTAVVSGSLIAVTAIVTFNVVQPWRGTPSLATSANHNPNNLERTSSNTMTVAPPVPPSTNHRFEVPNTTVSSATTSALRRVEGRVLFQDSFAQGLTKWDIFSRHRDGSLQPATETIRADHRLVAMERNGVTVRALELTGNADTEARAVIVSKDLRVGNIKAFSLSYEYTFTDRPRKAMEGIEIGLDRTLTQSAKPPGSWNSVRWECVRGHDDEGHSVLDAKLWFNEEFILKKQFSRPDSDPTVVLEVSDGQCFFTNVMIREMAVGEVQGSIP